MSKGQKIKYITTIVVLAFATSVFYHYIKGVYWGMPYPHNTFLFHPDDRFNDFFNSRKTSQDLDPYFGRAFFLPSNYYPFANVLFYLFLLLPPLISLGLFIAIYVLTFVYLNMVNLKTESNSDYVLNVFVFSFMTYPFLIAFDRMNLEALLFVSLAFFIQFYCKERLFISLIFLSLAIAMKLYPAVFLILLLADKKYRGTVFTVIVTLALTYVCIVFHKGGFWKNLTYILSGSGGNNSSTWVGNNNILQRGVSLLTFFKIIFIETKKIGQIDMVTFLNSYIRYVVISFAVLALYIRFVENELWKKVALLIFAMLLFPHVSADYKLIHVFIPLWLFVNCPTDSKFDLFYTIMFALLLIPKDYYLLPGVGSEAGNDINISVVLNVLIMLAMMLVIIRSGLGRWQKINKMRVVR
jgi:hypothetical protein